MAVGKVVAHLCLTLIIKDLRISVEHDRLVGSQEPTHCKVGSKPHHTPRGLPDVVYLFILDSFISVPTPASIKICD